MNEVQKEKFRRLTDNGTFRSQNVGRSSPVPYLFIRFATRKLASEYKEELGGGKIKKSGAQCFLMIGPALLRQYLPVIKDGLRKKYHQAEIVENWLKLLDENEKCPDAETIRSNRNKIEELKKKLINMNYAESSKKIDVVSIVSTVEVLRGQLAIYERTPEGVRSVFQKVRINDLRKKIAEKDPDGPEAGLFKKEKVCNFEDEVDVEQSMEGPGTSGCIQI